MVDKLTANFNSPLMCRQVQKTFFLQVLTKSRTFLFSSGVKTFLRPQFLYPLLEKKMWWPMYRKLWRCQQNANLDFEVARPRQPENRSIQNTLEKTAFREKRRSIFLYKIGLFPIDGMTANPSKFSKITVPFFFEAKTAGKSPPLEGRVVVT